MQNATKRLSLESVRCRPLRRYMRFTQYRPNCIWGTCKARQTCPTVPYTGNSIEERQSPSRRAAHHRGQAAYVTPIPHASLTLPADAPQAISAATVTYCFAHTQSSTCGTPSQFEQEVFSSSPRHDILDCA